MAAKKKNNTFADEFGVNYRFVSWFARVFEDSAPCGETFGKVLEWLKRHAWKACIRQKRIRGSNPLLSAKENLIKCLNISIN